MNLCAHNLRIGILGEKNIIRTENSRLYGPMGQLFEQLIFSKIQRNCSIFILNAFSGPPSSQNASNSSWFSMLQNDRLDLVWTKKELASVGRGIEGTSLVGAST